MTVHTCNLLYLSPIPHAPTGNCSVSRTVVEEEPEEEEDEVVHHRGGASHPASRASVNAPSHLLEAGEERAGAGDTDSGTIANMRAGGSGMVNTRIADRESAYQARGRQNQMVRGNVYFQYKT